MHIMSILPEIVSGESIRISDEYLLAQHKHRVTRCQVTQCDRHVGSGVAHCTTTKECTSWHSCKINQQY